MDEKTEAVKDTKFLFEDTKNDYVQEWMMDKKHQVGSIRDEYTALCDVKQR